MKTREIMNGNENLGWCKPLRLEPKDITISVNEGKIASIRRNGVDIDATPEAVKALAMEINDDYTDYTGWDDTHILLDAEGWKELGCSSCPWNDICDAMDEEV